MAEPTGKSDAPDTAHTGDAHRHAVTVDDAGVTVSYANFCRVSMLPEELVMDLGLNMQTFGAPAQTIKASQRVVLGYHTAKRLVGLLHAAVQRYESMFGPLEIDVQKRAQAGQARTSGPAGPH